MDQTVSSPNKPLERARGRVSLQFTPHVVPLLGAALLSVVLLPTAWNNRRDPIAVWFMATLATIFVWSVGYALEIMAVDLADKILLANLQFIALPAVAVCWWEMVRRHVGLRALPRAITGIIWAVPALTLIMAFTNPGQIFRGAPHIGNTAAPFPVLHADYGPWYWAVVLPFISVMTLASLAALAVAIGKADRFYRRQHGLLFVAVLLPAVGGFAYAFDVTPWRDYNPAVALLGFSGALVAVALFRCQLLATVPLAREKLVEDLCDPVIIADRSGRLVDLNLSARRLTGIDLRQAACLPTAQVFEEYPALAALLASPSSPGKEQSAEVAFEQDGVHRHFAVTSSPVNTRRGDYLGSVLVMHDVTERKKLLEQARELANSDDLTGLPNRRHFFELTEREYKRARRHGLPLSFLLMDIDHFKNVNDTFGHRVGDHLLEKLASACREVLRASDVIGRVGGEEFAILLPETGLEDAVEVAGRLRETVESLRVTDDKTDSEVAVTASMGLAQLDQELSEEEDSFHMLYEQADQALYAAKRSGRNMVVASRRVPRQLAAV